MNSIKWGIIGCGDVAEHKSGPPLYQTAGSELVAVMRRDQDKAADFARRHGVRRWYGDVEALLSDPDVNAVYIASPHYLHPAHAIQAAEAGKIVLCEKPMGTSSAEAQRVVDACRRHQAPLSVAYYRRFWPITQKIKQLLEEEAIGRVVQVRVQLSDYFNGDPDRPWLTSREKAGGGALANAGSHWVDLVLYLLGEVKEIVAYCSSMAGFEVEDTAGAVMRMASEAMVTFSSTWQGRIGVNDFDISGTGGRILASPLSDGQVVLHRHGREPEVFDMARTGPAHTEFIEEVVSCLLKGQAPPVPGEDVVAVWRVMEAAYQSSREGRRVAVA